MKAALWPRGRQGWIILLAALVTIATTARLGWWQLDRARQKTERQEALNRQKALPALTQGQLPLKPIEAAAATHRAVELNGQWQDAQTVYLDNRNMAGRAGFVVLTPLALQGGGVVLVQRGFWPRHLSDPQRVDAPPAPQGEVTVRGRVALLPSRMFELSERQPEGGSPRSRIRQNLEPSAYAAETGLPLLPWVLIQEDDSRTSSVSSSASAPVAADGLMRQWPQADLGKQKNWGYAFQWFAMSALALVLYLWFQVIKPMRRPKGNQRAAHPTA